MNVFDLFARLTLDTSEYERSLGGARDNASGAGSKIGGALKGGLKVAGAALTAAGTAVTAFAKSSVDAGSRFDSAMAQVAATSGKSMDELTAEIGTTSTAYGDFTGNLRDFAQFLGAETSFSATQAAEALNYMALAGYDAQQSMNMLPTVLDLAAAGGIDLAYASDMVTDAQSALGLTAEKTTEMVDKMALTSSKTNTSVSQLGEAILQIGATARSVKGGTTELSTVLGVLADNGIKGAEGGTHLRNIIMSLQNPTKDGIAALDALGVSVYDADGNMRSMVDIVADMQKGLDGMDQASRDAMINGIFNKTDAAAVNALLNTTQDRFATLTGLIDNATGAAQRMASTQLDNLAGDVTLFQSALEGAQIAISDALTPTLRNFVSFGTDAVSELGTAFRERGLEGALEALGPVIERGIQLIFNALPSVLTAAVALLNALVSGIINNLPMLIPAAIQLIQTLVQGIANNVPQIIDAAIEIMAALSTGIFEALPQLAPAIISIITAIVTKLTDPDTIKKMLSAALQIGNAIVKGLLNAIPELIKAVGKLGDAIQTPLKNFATAAKTLGSNIISAIRSGIASKISEITAQIQNLKDSISRIFKSLGDAALSWGRDLIGNFVNGLQEKLQALKNKAIGIAQQIKDVIGFSEPKEGPLSNFHTYAPDMMELFAKGIKDNESLVINAVKDSFNLRDQIGASFGGGRVVSSGAPRGISSGNGNTTVILQVDRTELGRVVFQLNDEETQRVGVRLATGGAYA